MTPGYAFSGTSSPARRAPSSTYWPVRAQDLSATTICSCAMGEHSSKDAAFPTMPDCVSAFWQPIPASWTGSRRRPILSTRESLPRHSATSLPTPAEELRSRPEKVVLLSTELADCLDVPTNTSRPSTSSSSGTTPRSSNRAWLPSPIHSRSATTWPPISAASARRSSTFSSHSSTSMTIPCKRPSACCWKSSPRGWRSRSCIRTRTRTSIQQNWSEG